jgi:hypothetical protein
VIDTAIAVAGSLNQLRQTREHRRRIALGCGRLADGQRYLALRLREARQRIEQQQNLQASIAKVLGDGRRQPGTVQAHQRRIVRRRGDNHGAPHAIGSQGIAHEILDLAAALADQSDHGNVGLGISSHHAEQHGLAHAGSCEKTDALSSADGEQRVDGAHAHIERIADRAPHEGIQRLSGQ